MNRRAKILLGVGMLLVAAAWYATSLVPNEQAVAPSPAPARVRLEAAYARELLKQPKPIDETWREKKLPRGSQRREFNGFEYYLVPLASIE